MNRELISEETTFHGNGGHDAAIADITKNLEASNHSVSCASTSTSAGGDRQTSYLLAKHPVYGEHMHIVHTSGGNTSSSKVGFGLKEEIIKESWEDISRRRAMEIMG